MFFDDIAYAMGSIGQGGGGEMGSPLSMNILLMVVIFAIFYFLIIRPQHKEAKRVKAMLSALKKGDRVLTVGGIYGTVLEVREEFVTLDLGDSTIEIGRKYISAIVEGRPAGLKGEKKRRSPAKKSAPKESMADQDTEFATDMVESEPEKSDGDESSDEAKNSEPETGPEQQEKK